MTPEWDGASVASGEDPLAHDASMDRFPRQSIVPRESRFTSVANTALEILDSSRSRRALRRKLRACKRNAKRRAQEEVIRRLMQAKRRERMREVEDKFDRYERWVEPREERPDWEEEGSSDHHEDDDWLLFEDDDLY